MRNRFQKPKFALIYFFIGVGIFGLVETSPAQTCSQSNDIILFGTNISPVGYTPNYDTPIWLASKWVLQEQLTGVTGGFWDGADSGFSYSGNFVFEIWTNNAAGGDHPGSLIGPGFTSSRSDVSNDASRNSFYFSSVQNLSPGTYWLLIKIPSFGGYPIYGGYGPEGTSLKSMDNGSTWASLQTGKNPSLGIYGCRQSNILFSDNFDNWPQVDGGNYFCCNDIAANCSSHNSMPFPWSANASVCWSVTPGGWSQNTMKIVDNGRSGKGFGHCRKGGVGLNSGYLGYLNTDNFQARKFYVRFYMNWPAALNKPISWFWKNNRHDGSTNGCGAILEGWADNSTMQAGTFGFSTGVAGNWYANLPVSAFNNGFVYLEYMVDLDTDTLKIWYGDTYNTEANPFWTRTNALLNCAPSDYIKNFNFGIGNDSGTDWLNPDWQCMVIDDVVVSTSFIGPIGSAPPNDTTPPAAPTGVRVN